MTTNQILRILKKKPGLDCSGIWREMGSPYGALEALAEKLGTLTQQGRIWQKQAIASDPVNRFYVTK